MGAGSFPALVLAAYLVLALVLGTAAAQAAEPGIAYETRIVGADAIGLTELMEKASLLNALAEKPPPSVDALRRRAKEDAHRLTDVLTSNGFYDGTITAQVAAEGDTHVVTLTVTPGVVYLLGDYAIAYGDNEPPAALMPDLEDLGLHVGMRADAGAIVDAEQALLTRFREAGYPWVKVDKRTVRLDRPQTLVLVQVAVTLDRRVAFGEPQYAGLEEVEAPFLRRLVPWKPGDTFAASQLEAYRRALTETGLFAAVGIAAQRPPEGADRAPIQVTLTERPHRSIGAGVNYASSEGPGAKVFWENRTLFGAGEKLRLTAAGNKIEQTLTADFTKPAYIHGNQQLLSQVELKRFDGPGFQQIGLGGRLGLERRNGPWRTALSGTVEAAKVEDDTGRHNNSLFGLPVEMGYDSTDSLLDPTTGARLDLVGTPYVGFSDSDLLTFAVLEATGSIYRRLDEDGRFVAAGRARVGTLLGEDRRDVPANKRFYAGGGGSIRGYEFQSVGPLSKTGDPEGGLSLIEVGAELRIRVYGDFGVVPFIDGGKVVDTAQPFDSTTIRWAAGLGLRYHTAVGPLRFDLAFPLNGRKDVDEDYQFYISLGQAF
ncbi:MAG: BamA/TamA family outer membrane protein [Rhodobacterales bacterium]|nr:BamA/TamA family outer membrane protein [Rhodobacterales bacterium]